MEEGGVTSRAASGGLSSFVICTRAHALPRRSGHACSSGCECWISEGMPNDGRGGWAGRRWPLFSRSFSSPLSLGRKKRAERSSMAVPQYQPRQREWRLGVTELFFFAVLLLFRMGRVAGGMGRLRRGGRFSTLPWTSSRVFALATPCWVSKTPRPLGVCAQV